MMERIFDNESERIKNLSQFAVLIGGESSGSNLMAILDACERGVLPQESVKLVVSNKPNSLALFQAYSYGIPYAVFPFLEETEPEREKYSGQLAEFLNKNGITVSVMAGFPVILSPAFSLTLQGVALNLHPGYVPHKVDSKHYYENGQEIPWNFRMSMVQAIDRFIELPTAFSSIHIVSPEGNFGTVAEYASVPVWQNETRESLRYRLKFEETNALIRTLRDVHRLFELAGKVY